MLDVDIQTYLPDHLLVNMDIATMDIATMDIATMVSSLEAARRSSITS